MESKYYEVSNLFKLFSGRYHPKLSQDIANYLGVELGNIRISTFPDSEIHVQIEESIRGCDVFVIQPTGPNVNENLMELLIMIDAFHRASAQRITAIIPYFGYARQDRKATGREPISAKLVSDLLTVVGADRVVTVDLHTAQIQGFFRIPVDHLTAMPILVNYFKNKGIENSVLVSPDVGRVKLVEKMADLLFLPMVVIHKRRLGGNVKVAEIVGDVKGKNTIIIDDLIASGSIVNQAKTLIEAGAKKVYIGVTHPVLVGNAIKLLDTSFIEEVVVVDTLPIPPEKQIPKLKILKIAPLLAEVIYRIHQNKSVSEVFTWI